MTNFEIIANAAIENGIYTEEQVKSIIESGHSLPLHTFSEWKRIGFIVKKGAKAAMTCFIWRYKENKKGNEEQPEEQKDGIEVCKDYYKTKAYFFTDKQVERIQTA